MLSKTAEYALRAVTCMGAQGERAVSADFLAQQTKVPRRYLTRVLQDLAAAGLVQSRPGPGGVGNLVRQKPSRSRVFEQLGIDFCCGGKVSLQRACEKRGLAVASVASARSQREQRTVSKSR